MITNVNVRVDSDIKEQAESILEKVSFTLNDAFDVMLRQICKEGKFPYVELTENGFTPEFEDEILAEAEETYKAIANGTLKPYDSPAEMFAAWEKEDAEDDC
ncbi:MAG: type II toxin-antitoxin system RelB/DinJ family antitoxin [Eubacterium sp.]|jgi:addiction module RelB/DinJ family antitoxin|nr:type II toxin-antitoxin system RelB/DinJ family antitoxin [Eubacterium sp.]